MRKRFTTEQIRFTDEQIIGILSAEIGAMSIKVLCKKHDLTEQTFPLAQQVRRHGCTRDLEPENAWLKRAVAEQMPVIDGLKETIQKKRPHRNDVARFRCWFIVVSRSVRPVDTVA